MPPVFNLPQIPYLVDYVLQIQDKAWVLALFHDRYGHFHEITYFQIQNKKQTNFLQNLNGTNNIKEPPKKKKCYECFFNTIW